MATLGLTKLMAVNQMVRAVNELPYSALDSTGAYPTATYGQSVAARAEEVLDEVTVDILSHGLDENTRYCQQLTASAGVFTVASDTLFVRPAGPDQWRKLCLEGDSVLDLTSGSTSWTGIATTLYVDRIYYKAFVNLTPRTKSFITKWATVIFQRRHRGSPEQDGYLTSEAFMAELASIRAMAWQSPPNPINPVPVMQPQPAQPGN